MDQRREAVQKHFWDDRDGYFADLDLETGQRRDRASAATLAPLMVGMATAPQADAVAALVNAKFLAPGGLRTTLCTSGEQWDMPNGWAPLQWIAVSGLRRYGHDDLAREVARSWIATVEATYRRTGLVHEKYDIEAATIGIGGEYEPQTGFGWTNGVTADFLDWLAKSHDEALGSLSLL
jgi:alpha,alpha-trehalase